MKTRYIILLLVVLALLYVSVESKKARRRPSKRAGQGGKAGAGKGGGRGGGGVPKGGGGPKGGKNPGKGGGSMEVVPDGGSMEVGMGGGPMGPGGKDLNETMGNNTNANCTAGEDCDDSMGEWDRQPPQCSMECVMMHRTLLALEEKIDNLAEDVGSLVDAMDTEPSDTETATETEDAGNET